MDLSNKKVIGSQKWLTKRLDRWKKGYNYAEKDHFRCGDVYSIFLSIKSSLFFGKVT